MKKNVTKNVKMLQQKNVIDFSNIGINNNINNNNNHNN